MEAGGAGYQRLPSAREATTPWPVGESFCSPGRAEEERAPGLLISLPQRGFRQCGECMCEVLSVHGPWSRPLGALALRYTPACLFSRVPSSVVLRSLLTGKERKKTLLAIWFLFPCVAQTGGRIHERQREETEPRSLPQREKANSHHAVGLFPKALPCCLIRSKEVCVCAFLP